VLYTRRVPLLRILVLVFAIANASGLTDAVMGSACGDECVEVGSDSDCDGTCPPVCPTCHCAVRSPVAMTAAPVCVEPPRQALGVAFADGDRDPGCPDPSEILHVPRRSVRVA
jgi:hypothetical protein